ncbi:aminotransferase class IV family protein [Tianweitania sp. BSSL-BM11]|uniref:Probable branched-chain-amino-acid aminotransferase n=1 Tax=Tianweitania aestuarii TaxID=2814886 RepID=A0ABS5RVD7_9HYPH|nr:aminotransferase class IV family protein [Tianweitania aestuarii]MBS9721014.1 aminotransferase class IV family protein [Tianweitania aestuarii]
MSVEGALRHRLNPTDYLIETFRYEPDEGFLRLDRHLERLKRSADMLGFRYDDAAINLVLSELLHDRDPLRVRLTLDREGNLETTTQRFFPLAKDTIWTLHLAATKLPSHDPLLAHKTSRRTLYETARAEFAAHEAQEVLLCNERGELCEGTITNLFVDEGDGRLATPPLDCGLLGGVLRAELLQSGRAVERVLFPHDLQNNRIYVGNSLRGLIAARFSA